MANPAPTINQINAFNATQGTTIDFNIIGGTELIRSNRIYIYDLSDNSLICTHLYVSTESIHEFPPNTDGSIVYESGKSSADFVNGAQYYAQIQTYTDTNGTQGGSGLSVAKMFWCLGDPTLTITTIPSTISTTSYNISATYTDTSASVVSNIIQQYQFNLYSATGSLLQSSGVVVGSGTQQGTSAVYDISYNFTGLNVGSSYYVTVDVTTTQGMSVNAQSNTFTVSIDTPTLGEATVVNNACDGYISVTSNLSGEYGGSGSGEIVSFETDSENVFSKLQVDNLEPVQEGSGNPSPSNVRPIRGHSGVDVNVVGKNLFDGNAYRCAINTNKAYVVDNTPITSPYTNINKYNGVGFVCNLKGGETYALSTDVDGADDAIYWALYETEEDAHNINNSIKNGQSNFPTFTVDTDCVLVFMRYANASQVVSWTYAQVELGFTATPYEPYNAQTITQDFNATLTPTSTDTTPYSFKAVGDVYGDRLEDKIVGGTVAWNQMAEELNATNWIAESGVTISFEDDVIVISSTTVNNGAASVTYPTFKNGNKYLVTSKVKTETDLDDVIVGAVSSTGVSKSKSVQAGQWVDNSYIAQSVVDGTKRLYCYARNTQYSNLRVKDVMVIDLTQMFGSTIADYIYSLEQSQAGAGVAWFKKLFPNDYYAYDAGTLKSVEGLSEHRTTGKNLFDESYPNINGSIRYRAIHVGAGTFTMSTSLPLYDGSANLFFFAGNVSSGASTSSNGVSTSASRTVTSSNGYVTVAYRIVNGVSQYSPVNYNTQIERGSTATTYEPYHANSYPLDSSLTLRGIPKLDASNNLYYDGDEYTSDGKVKRKYGIVDLGTFNWYIYTYGKSTIFRYDGYVGKRPNEAYKANIICSEYETVSADDMYYSNVDKSIALHNGAIGLMITDSAYTDATAFKAAMSGVMLVYELATPTTETAQAYTNPQIVSKYGTIEYVTNSIVPVGHKTTYLTRDIFGGYVDLISGKLVVDRKLLALSSLEWVYLASSTLFYANIPNDASSVGDGDANALCSCYERGRYSTLTNNQFFINDDDFSSTKRICVRDTRYTDATQFKNAMNGQTAIYTLETPQTYQLTPQQVNTLVGTNNVWSEQGSIELSYHIPITNLLVKRQDVDDVGGGWLTLYSQPITQASDMDFTFIDFLNQYGKTYKYALVPLLTQTQSGVEVEVEGGYTVSNEVQSVFDGVFIADSTGSQKCKANVGYGNVDMNQVVGSITPIGAKYPIIITNSHNQYHNGSISGTIVPDDYYFNGNLSRIDMVNKRNELEQFLTNKRVKVIKDWNGNIWLVMIAGNVSCTFNNNYGMGIVSFSTNWTEVGDPTNQQDLQATGLINVGGV